MLTAPMQNRMNGDLSTATRDMNGGTSSPPSKNGSPQQQHRSKKVVHFGKNRRKVSVGPDLGVSSGYNSPSALADIFDWLRPRAFSDQAKNRRKSVDSNLLTSVGRGTSGSSSRCSSTSTSSVNAPVKEEFHSSEDINRPLFVDAKMATSWVNSIPQEYLYQRATHSAEYLSTKNVSRPRSNSEVGRYLLVRRSREPNGRNDIIGRLEDASEQAYCQLLSNIKCYDLMPQFTKVIALESKLPVRKAFIALVNNFVRAAVVIDPKNCSIVGMLTVTDFLNVLIETSTKKSTEYLNLPLSKVFANRKGSPVMLNVDESLYKATKLLCQRSVHRIIMVDSENNGNPLFLLSKKMILQSLQKYISLLPMASCMQNALEDLKIGTWDNINTVKLKTTVHQAILKFLNKNVSCLPVVDSNSYVLDVLTKVDLMNLVADEGPTESILQKTIEEIITTKHSGVEKMITCNCKSTLFAAVESLLQTNAHRLIVTDTNGHLESIISIADLMRFFVGNV